MSSGTSPAAFPEGSRTTSTHRLRTPRQPEPASARGGTSPAAFPEGPRTSSAPSDAAHAPLTRRGFALATACAGLAALAPGLARASEAADATATSDARTFGLPPASPDPDSQFGVDANVNMDTIDDYLNLPGVAYRDARLLKDPADYASIGGDSVLSFGLPGFKVVPFPQLGTLQELPVSGAYTGERLFDVTWASDGTVADARPRYEESELIVADLFPKDAPIVLVCGGGGYAGMTKSLLTYFGYDPSLLYNAGGMWDYTGYEAVELAHHDEATGKTSYYFWRADVPQIDFSLLTPKDA